MIRFYLIFFMDSVELAFRAYQELSPTDEQVVFRDMMKRLYTPVLNNWGILSHKRYTKPDKDYLTAFDLKNREIIDYVGEMEKRAMYILAQVGVFKSFGKYHQKMDTSDFRFNKPIVYSFSFELNKPEIFFELYKLIFKESPENAVIVEPTEPQSKPPKKKMVNPRIFLEFDDLTYKLRVKDTDKVATSVQRGMKPLEILMGIFIEGKNLFKISELKDKKIPSSTTMASILGKNKIYPIIFEIGRDYVRLRKNVDKEAVLALCKTDRHIL